MVVNNIFFCDARDCVQEFHFLHFILDRNLQADMIVILTLLFALIQYGISFRSSFVPKLHVRAPILSVQAINTVPTTRGIEDSLKKQIYCNVALNGSYIEAVGFDLSYTIAQVCTLDR